MWKTKASKMTLSPLQEMRALLCEDLVDVNQVMKEQLVSPTFLVKEVADYLLETPGKQLRAMVTLVSARACRRESHPNAIILAACVELIHTATLLHDDVIDRSPMRRGKKSVQGVWGNHASILMGDFLFSRAFELAVEINSLPLLGLLSKTIGSMAEGELLQMNAQGKREIDEETYFEIIQAKTAQLFSAACKGGGVVVSASVDEISALESYGYNLGILFQVRDDLLDGDLKTSCGKVLKKAEVCRQKALKALEVFPASCEKNLLLELVNFCLHRKA